MTSIDRATRSDLPLRTDHQLRIALEDLLERANLAQLWVIFLDADDRLTGPFMPGDGFPDDPLELVRTDDLGEVPVAHVLAERVKMMIEAVGAARAVLVWERPGADGLTPDVRAWVREMALACRANGAALRAQLLLHNNGLRMLVPDDYV
jgi:hypothetical protein